MAVTTGIREALMFAENQGKIVTLTAGSMVITGKVLRVSPLVIEANDTKLGTVINFDMVTAVAIQGTDAVAVVNACKPQAETRYATERKL